MSDAPLSPNPLGDAAATEDQVGLAGYSMLAGIASAIGTYSPIVGAARYFAERNGNSDPTQVSTSSPEFLLVQVGLPIGLVLSGGVAWWLMRPIAQLWRRGGLAITTALIGLVLAMVLTLFAHTAFGNPGLASLSVASWTGALLAARAARNRAPSA